VIVVTTIAIIATAVMGGDKSVRPMASIMIIMTMIAII